MMWNIFRKDLRLLWKPVLAVALTQWIEIWFRTRMGEVYGYVILSITTPLSLMAASYLLVAMVQLDSLTSDRQDWLIRPISRRQLMGGKLLFAAIAVIGPIFAGNLLLAFALGFPAASILSAAVSHAALLLFCVAIPIMALAACTRNLGETVLVCVLAMGGALGVQTLFSMVSREPQRVRSIWPVEAVALGIVFLGGASILLMQYYWRRRNWAYLTLAFFALFFVVAVHAPSTIAFIPDATRKATADAGEFRFVFSPEKGRMKANPLKASTIVKAGESRTIHLPLTIESSKDPAASILTDSIALQITNDDGHSLAATVLNRSLSESAPGLQYQAFYVGDSNTWNTYGDKVGHANIALSIISLDTTSAILRSNEPPKQIPGLGICQVSARLKYRDIRCLQLGDQTAVARVESGGELRLRSDSYSPLFLSPIPGGMFQVSSVLAHGDWEELPLKVFRVSRLRRVTLDIPNFRLNDWTSEEVAPQGRSGR